MNSLFWEGDALVRLNAPMKSELRGLKNAALNMC